MINRLGDIRGYAKTNGNAANQAFVWANGAITGLHSLGGANSYALDINIAGYFFLKDNGNMRGAVRIEHRHRPAMFWVYVQLVDPFLLANGKF